MRSILLLGASGSIGTQTLDVMEKESDRFNLLGFSVGLRVNVIEGILSRHPNVESICVKKEEDANKLKKQYPSLNIFWGDSGLEELVSSTKADMVVNALVGFSGLVPSVRALEHNKILALANKESLVVGGNLINRLLDEGHGVLYPIDSEHVAIAKMVHRAGGIENVEKILITGSGGPFRKQTRESLADVTPEMALNHPTWKMGGKITIDSATMMNKGFEVVEACHLFHIPPEKVQVILHDESYVHSMLLLKDGTYMADISAPDMRVPIYWALHESNCDYKIYRANKIEEFGPYHFHEFNPDRYPAVSICVNAYLEGGIVPTILNAANEIAVYSFLDGKTPFLSIEEAVKKAILHFANEKNPSLDDIVSIDKSARAYTEEILKGEPICR